jgi:hypothetical protein
MLDNPTSAKPTLLWEYLTMTIKLWAKHIAGPVISLIAIVSVIVAAFVRNNPSRAAMIVVWTAWSTSVATILLMFVAQYEAWKQINQSLAIENSKNEAAPHMDITVLNVVPLGSLGEGLTELFFHVRLVLGEPSQVSIRDFTLQISNEATSLTANVIEDVTEWSLVKSVGRFSRFHCVPLSKELSRRGDPVQGWVHFRIPSVSESALQRCTLIFKVNCIHGTCYLYLNGDCVQPDADGKGIMMKLPSHENMI